MGIRLNIEIISPLEPDDRDLLTGLSIMIMAVANHEMAKAHFPDVFPTDEEMAAARQEQQAMPCASADGEGRFCVSEVGHKGRHKYRQILPPHEGVN